MFRLVQAHASYEQKQEWGLQCVCAGNADTSVGIWRRPWAQCWICKVGPGFSHHSLFLMLMSSIFLPFLFYLVLWSFSEFPESAFLSFLLKESFRVAASWIQTLIQELAGIICTSGFYLTSPFCPFPPCGGDKIHGRTVSCHSSAFLYFASSLFY
jgi:hypothetical protein